MTHTLRKLPLLALCLYSTTAQLFSQAGVASLSGIVVDPSQAIVSRAKITATNQATGISRSTTTDDAGYYAFSSLPVGRYEISAEGTGFNASRQTIMLDPSAKARVDFQLAMAGATATVEVQ